MSSLRAANLAKWYKSRQVVDDVALQVNSGEIIGLLGPNGAGKTTCFYMLVGLVRCDRGTIRLNERDITRAPMHVRARAGLSYLPQEASVFRKLSVADNIKAILQTRRDLNRSQRMQRQERLLDEFQIGHIAGSLGISLSGGERRRVEIARALAMDPD
ncbi:MAG: ATP-binding cassette domain-containing protein, partial [Pseudomonadota bacterium]|nr:ATP-binding cassette domain-containing protein [Pseudomonadota bacterium]